MFFLKSPFRDERCSFGFASHKDKDIFVVPKNVLSSKNCVTGSLTPSTNSPGDLAFFNTV
jgi:hypothetical protein